MSSHAESCLEAGLAALKQGNYYTAIANLEPLAKEQSQEKTCLQAQVGLVMTYARTGEVSQAIALCQNLIASSNPQVQEWATLALEHLHKRKNQKQKAHKTNTRPIPKSISPGQPPPTAYIGTDSNYNLKPITVYWRNARRAKVWQPLHKPNIIPSRLLALVTFLALLWMCREMVKFLLALINQILYQLPYLEPIPILYRDPSSLILGLLVILMAASPWLLDWILSKFYGQRELSKEKLNSYSRETLRVLQRTCQQQHWPTPQLNVLPIPAPIIITYGNLRRTARISVSQGLLEQLADDEIAAIYSLCLGQIGRWELMVISLILLITLPFYGLYQQISTLGNKYPGKLWHWPSTVLAALTYSIWYLFTGTALLSCRTRFYHTDTIAAEITGNPNGVIRALLKISIGIAHDISLKEQTSWQLESLNLLAPVAYQHSITLGSTISHLPLESFLKWENFHPYRQLLSINSCHPLIGDRLQHLCQIARHWHLDTEIHQTNPQKPLKVKLSSLWLQLAPWLGTLLGVVLAGIVWVLWQTVYSLHLLNLKWIYDNWSFVKGCMLIGFSVGTVARINTLFPEITPTNSQKDEDLTTILADPAISPIDSIKVRLTGKLIGRPGIGNCLAQDLILQSHQGLIKLHYVPRIGKSFSIQNLIGRQVTITGWLRRASTPWIDIQTLEIQGGKKIHSPHAICSTILAFATQAWGAYILLIGF